MLVFMRLPPSFASVHGDLLPWGKVGGLRYLAYLFFECVL